MSIETPAPSPSYHDLYITTRDIPRTALFNLPFGLEVSCTRVGGWALWDKNQINYGGGRIAPSRGVLIAGEYDNDWLVLDVAGHVILDSRNRHNERNMREETADVDG